jgi:hypothetical protein
MRGNRAAKPGDKSHFWKSLIFLGFGDLRGGGSTGPVRFPEWILKIKLRRLIKSKSFLFS